MRNHRIFSSIRDFSCRHVSSQKSPVKSSTKQLSRFDRFVARSPKFLHRHLQSLRSAPVTHISAFLVLHELTAVVPLFGLAGAFHYYSWLPPYFAEGAWVVAGVEKFGKYARRKGWISASEEQEAEQEIKLGDSTGRSGKWFNRGEGSVRWIVEFATAYAVVKALLVPRLILSAWAAPWFARWTVIPFVKGIKNLRSKPRGVHNLKE